MSKKSRKERRKKRREERKKRRKERRKKRKEKLKYALLTPYRPVIRFMLKSLAGIKTSWKTKNKELAELLKKHILKRSYEETGLIASYEELEHIGEADLITAIINAIKDFLSKNKDNKEVEEGIKDEEKDEEKAKKEKKEKDTEIEPSLFIPLNIGLGLGLLVLISIFAFRR